MMNGVQLTKTMTQQLSNATIIKLADVLFSEALTYIETDEEFIETLVSIIRRFLIDRMGQMDDNLLNELSIQILEKINIAPDNK